MLLVAFSVGSLLASLLTTCMCFFSSRKSAAHKAEREAALHVQAERAAAAAARGEAPTLLQRLSGNSTASSAPGLHRDSLREPLLTSIPEHDSDAALPVAALPPQQLEEVPRCVQTFLERAVRDDRPWKLFTLTQLGQMKMDPKGGWKEATATQLACPLEPAFVWSATASLAPFVTLRGCDSFVDNSGECAWHLWGSVPAASAAGREVDRTLHLRWLADAACFPQALVPSRFLRWEQVPGESNEAEAVLTYGGLTVRAVFTFDRFGRVVRLRTRDALRRLSNGGYELGEWRVAYSGHMLFGLTPQGPVIHEEMATMAGIHIPTNMEQSWVLPDGSRWVYARLTVAKVTAE